MDVLTHPAFVTIVMAAVMMFLYVRGQIALSKRTIEHAKRWAAGAHTAFMADPSAVSQGAEALS